MEASTLKFLQRGLNEKILNRVRSLLTNKGPERVPDKVTDKKIGRAILAIDLLIFSNIMLWILGIIYFLVHTGNGSQV